MLLKHVSINHSTKSVNTITYVNRNSVNIIFQLFKLDNCHLCKIIYEIRLDKTVRRFNVHITNYENV